MPLYKIGGVLESEEDSEFGVFRFHVGPDSERGASEVFCPRTWVVLRAWPPAQDVALKTCSLVQDVSPVRGLNPQDGPLGHDVAHSWWRAWTAGMVTLIVLSFQAWPRAWRWCRSLSGSWPRTEV